MITFGPAFLSRIPSSAADVVVTTLGGSPADLAQPVAVDGAGRVSFAVETAGTYRVTIYVNGYGVDEKITLTAAGGGSASTGTGIFDTIARRYSPLVYTIATSGTFPGIDPTGATDSSAGLQAAINATPSGGTLVVPPGTYLASNLLSAGKSINVEAVGATFVQATNAPTLTLRGLYNSSVAVSASANETRTVLGTSRSQARITLVDAAPSSWRVGDVIKIISDDVITGARPGTGGSESRRGEFGTIYEISGSTVYFSGPLRDTYTTNVRASRIQHSVSLNGGTFTTRDENLADFTRQHVSIESCIAPRVIDVEIIQGGGQGIIFKGGLGGSAENVSIAHLRDDSATGHYGYGILDNSWEGLTVSSLTARHVRHAYTDDTLRIAAGSSDIAAYGPSRGARIINSYAFGTSGVAWDTHSAGEDATFTSTVAVGCDTGFGFRGRRHTAIGCSSDGSAVGFWVRTDGETEVSYEHKVIDCVTRNARLDAIVVDQVSTTPSGRTSLVVDGGVHTSSSRGMRMERVTVRLQGGVRFEAGESVPSGHATDINQATGLVQITAGTLLIGPGGVEIDGSRITSGSRLAFIRMTSSNSQVIGRGLTARYSTDTNRFPNVFIGTGKWSLRDVEITANPTGAVMTAAALAGSRIQYYNPASLDGNVVSN